MALSDAYKKEGQHSLRIRSTSNVARVAGEGEWEDLVATRKFPGEDWRKYNRISLWVYADVTGAPAISASLMLHNEGAHIAARPIQRRPRRVDPAEKPRVESLVWEIAPLDRDKITAHRFRLQPAEDISRPGRPDHSLHRSTGAAEGRTRPCGRMGCRSGENRLQPQRIYVGSSKSAIASDLTARDFSVIDQQTGKAVLTKAVEETDTRWATIR